MQNKEDKKVIKETKKVNLLQVLTLRKPLTRALAPWDSKANNDYITWMSMAVDQVCWTSSDIVKTPVEIARWTMSFSLTAQTSSTGRPILCTYRPAVDNNEKSQKYYTMIASHADDFLGIIGTCAKVKRTSVWEANVGSFCRYLYRHHTDTKEPNNRVLLGGFIVWLYCFFYCT